MLINRGCSVYVVVKWINVFNFLLSYRIIMYFYFVMVLGIGEVDFFVF